MTDGEREMAPTLESREDATHVEDLNSDETRPTHALDSAYFWVGIGFVLGGFTVPFLFLTGGYAGLPLESTLVMVATAFVFMLGAFAILTHREQTGNETTADTTDT